MEEQEYCIDEHDLRIFKNVLEHPQLANEFIYNFEPSVFINSISKKIANQITIYIKNYKVPPTTRVLLDSVNDYPNVKKEFEIAFSIMDGIHTDLNEFRYDLDKVKNKYISQLAGNLKNEIANINLDSEDQTINLLKSARDIFAKAEKISSPNKQIYTQISLKNYLPEFKQKYTDKFHNKDLDRGFLTHYANIDYLTNGFSMADFIIIGGQTGAGKSVLLNNLAIQMWMGKNKIEDQSNFSPGRNVLYFSLEMPYDLCIRRTLSRVADVPTYGIRDATLNKSEVQSLNNAAQFINNYPNHFEVIDIPRGITVDDIEARYLEACTRFKPEIIVVDYLGLLDDPSFKGDDWLKLGHIAGRLHEFARAYNVVVISAAQLNRNSKSQESEIGIHRFGRSSLILHHVTLAMQIETRPDEHTFGDMVVHVVKNRNGALGNFSLAKNFANCSIRDHEQVFLPDTSSRLYLPQEAADISGLLNELKWSL